MSKTKWEIVIQNTCKGTYRMKVPGGWLIQVEDCDGSPSSLALTFLPDPEYKWEIGEEK